MKRGLVHLWRHAHAHTLCGQYMAPMARKHSAVSARVPIDCPDCLEVGRRWLDEKVWTGFGKIPPGRDATWELWLALPEGIGAIPAAPSS